MKKYRKAKNVRQREREICICRKKERNAKNVRQTDRERETRKTLGRQRDTEREKK